MGAAAASTRPQRIQPPHALRVIARGARHSRPHLQSLECAGMRLGIRSGQLPGQENQRLDPEEHSH
eukprot:4433804-Heterocapsa_arctica.AAC.1